MQLLTPISFCQSQFKLSNAHPKYTHSSPREGKTLLQPQVYAAQLYANSKSCLKLSSHLQPVLTHLRAQPPRSICAQTCFLAAKQAEEPETE